jgi:putative Mg2+ transporter-C (MgtC) family protein
MWSTGVVGIAVGLGRLETAIALSVMTFLTFKLVGTVKQVPFFRATIVGP